MPKTKRALMFRAIWLIVGILFTVNIATASAQTSLYKQLQTPFYDASSSSTCSSANLSGSDNEQKTWNYFINQGLNEPQTAGIMGNMLQESHFDPLIMQAGGKSQDPYDAGDLGWGIIQWSGNGDSGHSTGDKVTSLYKASGLTAPIHELATQLDLVWGHMQNKPPITKGDFSLDDFKKFSDEKQASLYFRDHIEGGTDPDGVREGFASKILDQYKNSVDATTSPTVGGCTNSFSNGACSVSEPVYENQYSQSQLAEIFGDPGTADSHPGLHLVSATFLGKEATVNPLVAPCLEGVSKQIEALNINYPLKQFGCYRFDADNGSSNIGLRSYHSYGAACDINWDTNPWSGDGSVKSYDMPQGFIQAFHDHGFTWGGDWHDVKDYMHFEWHGVVPN